MRPASEPSHTLGDHGTGAGVLYTLSQSEVGAVISQQGC